MYVYLRRLLLSNVFAVIRKAVFWMENKGRFGVPIYLHRSVRPEPAVENLFKKLQRRLEQCLDE
jgi:hypothetical protein